MVDLEQPIVLVLVGLGFQEEREDQGMGGQKVDEFGFGWKRGYDFFSFIDGSLWSSFFSIMRRDWGLEEEEGFEEEDGHFIRSPFILFIVEDFLFL